VPVGGHESVVKHLPPRANRLGISHSAKNRPPTSPWITPNLHRTHPWRQQVPPGSPGLRPNLHPTYRLARLWVSHQDARRLCHRLSRSRKPTAPAKPGS